MKTTVDLPDDILAAAKDVSAKQGTTLRSLVEEGLRWVIRRRTKQAEFALRDASVGGSGVQPGIVEGSWEHLRDSIYEGRGS